MEKKIIEWFVTGDTGIFSEAMVDRFMGIDTKRNYGDHPHDSSDFGRCYRLLEAVPEFKNRISEMATRSNEWAALVYHWDELTELYVNDGKCYERMKEILAVVKDKAGVDLGNGVTMYS